MKYLVLGPASMGIYALIGAVKSMEPMLGHVKEISGSSAGAILALFLAVGLSVDDIIDAALSIEISNFVKLNIGSFFNKFGFVELGPIREKLVEICGCDPTFSELKKKIYISAFCLNTSRTEYFSKDTHPNMKVIDAVCMSIAIPLIFASSEYDGRTYVDGGTAEEYPMGPFLDKKPHEIVCLRIKMDEIYQEHLETPKDFLEALIRSSIKNRLKYDGKFKLIAIDIGNVNVFDFNMSYEDKLRLMSMGYACEK